MPAAGLMFGIGAGIGDALEVVVGRAMMKQSKMTPALYYLMQGNVYSRLTSRLRTISEVVIGKIWAEQLAVTWYSA